MVILKQSFDHCSICIAKPCKYNLHCPYIDWQPLIEWKDSYSINYDSYSPGIES